jgi:hypothetical protein
MPDEQFLHQCALALDKWMGQLITFQFIFLGLLYNTGKMTAAITEDYLHELKELLDTSGMEDFLLSESEVLLGKSARCGDYHLMMHSKFGCLCSQGKHKLSEKEPPIFCLCQEDQRT